MNFSPLFSLVIPTYNPGEKLKITLDSIRSQNFDALEILVQDGASTDETRGFLESQRDVLWQSERDGGIYDAMNRAIARSSGRFLMFLGAGDMLEPNVLGEVAACVSGEAGLHFVYGQVRLSDGALYDGAFSPSKLRTKNICQQAIFYERTLFERLGKFDLRYPLLSDWEWNFRCFGDANIKKQFLPLTVARYEGGGRSRARDEAFLRDRLTLIRRHLGARQFALALAAKMVPGALKIRLKGRSA